ncbi:hypothetical protein [Actinomadura sp. CNU-125]|uniref:hypothetical protein n=1 Tax=Actinomadura sp. CNU-125 TaxID=1904961 RepID=UPI0011781616|nr:hypothetical protein [Actinomadura sp. CNU-125]
MSNDDKPVHIPPSVSLPDLAPWERHIWRTPDLTVEERRAAILLVRLQRGELTDTGEVLALYHALGNILRRLP